MELMVVVFFISFILVASGATVKIVQNIFLTEPLVAMLAGILLGPEVLDLIHSDEVPKKHHIIELACQFTIAMALMATALRIPMDFYKKDFITQSNIVFFGMILMWLASSSLLYWILSGFSFAACLLMGAIITPTDPVVASTIITGENAKKYLPARVRNTLSFEAGANDGLAYPIVFFSVFLLQHQSFPVGEWLSKTLLYETVLSSLIAYGVGYLAGKVMHKAHAAGIINERALLPYSLGLAFLLLSGLEALNMNGIVGVFIGGIAFSRHIAENEELQEEKVQESMERIFTIPVFFLFGLFIPWQEWLSLGWTAVWIAVLLILFRRVPAFLLLMPLLPKFRKKVLDVLIMGWFGPIGVAALFYAVLAKEKTGLEEAWVIPALVVFASTILHAITSLPFEKLYHKKTNNKAE